MLEPGHTAIPHSPFSILHYFSEIYSRKISLKNNGEWRMENVEWQYAR
jgi:hypothetical protein